MKKSTNIENKMKVYASLALGIAGIGFVNGQIVYTDVNPDETITVTPGTTETGAYAVDMDADGTADFSIQNRAYGTANVQANCMSLTSSNMTLGSMGAYTSFGYAAAIAAGTTIDASSATWNAGVAQMVLASVYNGSSYYGNLGDGAEHFLGVTFNTGGSVYFGWIRVKDIPTDGSTVTIVDFAYESTADGAIIAGATTTSLADDLNQFDVAVYSSDKKINIVSDQAGAKVSVYNISGQMIHSESVQQGHSVIDMTTMSSGIYNVVVENNGQILNRKVSL